MIYLDNAATTKVLDASWQAAQKAYFELFYNPSARYYHADAVREQMEAARKTIADFLCAEPSEVYFTSGATESNNWAVRSAAQKRKKLKSVTSKGEHASVYEPFVDLQRRGVLVDFASLQSSTHVDCNEFIQKATDCGFASLIHASNETGVVHDIASIFSEIRKVNKQAILHADGVQAFCKIDTDVRRLGVDLYSVSGHKVGAPKGIGALYIRKGLHLSSQMHGGGQERMMRAGTENVAGILAFGAAALEYRRVYHETDFASIRSAFCHKLMQIGQIEQNGCAEHALPNIISFSVGGIKAEVLQRILAREDEILIGTGSACAASMRGNRVLAAAGRTQSEIDGNIRISFGLEMNLKTAIYAAEQIADRIIKLREAQSGSK